MSESIPDFLSRALGYSPKDLALFERALTHSSATGDSYERLEFLGDRVLGLVIASLLYDRFANEPEGKLSRRYNALVARETCAEIGHELRIAPWIRLGKQAREDGANRSDNVVGDVVEALIGALFVEAGFETAREFIANAWGSRLESQVKAPQHPKSELQEAAAARNLPVPVYELAGRTGAHHAPRFSVKVSIKGVGEAIAEGSSKQEAETEAARHLLEKFR